MDESREGDNPELEEGEDRKGQADALIVFGFGIKDPYWLEKANEKASAKTLPGEVDNNALAEDQPTPSELSSGWMLSKGAKMRVQAASELYLQGAAKEIIFTGGATRKKDGLNQTEAQLMEDYFLHILKKRKIEQLKAGRTELSLIERRDIEHAADAYIEGAAEKLIKEDGATNTIENFSRTLAMFDQNPDKYKSVGFLSNRFHIDRIVQLAGQFDLEGEGFSAEDEISSAREGKRHEKMFSKVLNNYLNSQEYIDYSLTENRWKRGLAEVPEYFLPQTIFVEGKRLKEILKNMAKAEEQYAKTLLEMGIDPDEIDTFDDDQMAEVKKKLEAIERILPEAEKLSGIIDPLERAKHLQTLIFSDVDGTLFSSESDQQKVGRYLQMAERCSGETVLTSSRSRGDLEDLRSKYGMSELAPIIFENGGGVIINKKIISLEELQKIADEQAFMNVTISDEIDSYLIEFSPRKEELKEAFDQVLQEVGLEARYVLDLSPEEIATLYSCSIEQAQNIKNRTPREKKYYMENVIFPEPPTALQQSQMIALAREKSLHLTRARLTWHLMSEGVHKGKAAEFVQAIYRKASANYQQSVAIGDAPNDYEMFASCDKAFYVGDDEIVPKQGQPTLAKGPMGAIEVMKELFLVKENK